MDVMYNMINIINTTVCYMTFKGANPEFSSQGEKILYFFSISLILNPREMMNILYTFHVEMMYVIKSLCHTLQTYTGLCVHSLSETVWEKSCWEHLLDVFC